jgi:hypothetical protein
VPFASAPGPGKKGKKTWPYISDSGPFWASCPSRSPVRAYYDIKTDDADDTFYFKGSEETMEFVSRTPIVPGTLTGVVFVKYEILKGVEKGRWQLKLYEKDAGFLKEEDLVSQKDEDFLTLIPGVENLQFEYLREDEDGTSWQRSWEPSETDGMPLAVKILLKQDEASAPINLIIPIRCQKE